MGLTSSTTWGTTLWEAMFRASSTLDWLEQQEQHKPTPDLFFLELQENLSKVASSLGVFVNAASRGNYEIRVDLKALVGLIESLTEMTKMVMSKTRETLLPQAPEPLNKTIALMIGTIESLADKTEDIIEGWKISLDEESVRDLRNRASEPGSPRGEIPDWRQALELICDRPQ